MTDSFHSEDWVQALTPLLAGDVAAYVLQAAGPCRVQLVGAELLHLTGPLLAAGCSVVHQEERVDGIPAADLVIAWVTTAENRAAWLGRDLDAETLALVCPSGADCAVNGGDHAPAGQWQQHPAVFALPAAPEGASVHLYTRFGVTVLDAASLGRASFHGLAAALVRPGDAVLATDAAENALWRIVLEQSRCSWLGVVSELPAPVTEPAGLEWFDESQWIGLQRSVDVVIASLSRGSGEWMQVLQSAQTALVRSGRLIVMAPLEPGKNLQRSGLKALFERLGFVIDRAWWKVPECPLGPAQFIEFPHDSTGQLLLESRPAASADAMVLMAVNIRGVGVVQDPTLTAPNLIAFKRDYIDASVVRQIVAVGLRLESAALRRQVAQSVMRDAPQDSADYGAALCVLLYDPNAMVGPAREQLLSAAKRFIDFPAVNPTALRWKVSLAFVSALEYQSGGDIAQAAELYARVLEFDVLAFSPLLGTKTTAAALRLGWIHFARGDLAEARSAWARGLEEARRLVSQPDWAAVVGDPDAPETFAMPELAAVMDEAGGLASALRLTSEMPIRPGLAWQWANRSWRTQLQEARTEQQRRQVWQDNLQDAKDWLDTQYRQLNNELDRREQVILELDAKAQTLAIDNHGVRAAYRLAHLHAANEKNSLVQQLNSAEALREALVADNLKLVGDNHRLSDTNQRLLEEQRALEQTHQQLLGGHQALAGTYQQLLNAHDALTGTHQQLIGAHRQLIGAAQHLSVAANEYIGKEPHAALPEERIADELSSQALALDRIPLKGVVRALMRSLAFAFGRK